MTIVTVILLF